MSESGRIPVNAAPGEYSVAITFPNGTNKYECRWVDADTAFHTFLSFINRPAARMGMIVCVVVTDGGDFTNLQWEFGKGIVYPTEQDVQEFLKKDQPKEQKMEAVRKEYGDTTLVIEPLAQEKDGLYHAIMTDDMGNDQQATLTEAQAKQLLAEMDENNDNEDALMYKPDSIMLAHFDKFLP